MHWRPRRTDIFGALALRERGQRRAAATACLACSVYERIARRRGSAGHPRLAGRHRPHRLSGQRGGGRGALPRRTGRGGRAPLRRGPDRSGIAGRQRRRRDPGPAHPPAASHVGGGDHSRRRRSPVSRAAGWRLRLSAEGVAAGRPGGATAAHRPGRAAAVAADRAAGAELLHEWRPARPGIEPIRRRRGGT